MTDGGALAALADRIGHAFRDRELLVEALRHRSWCAEHRQAPSNERLEFLGDAILGLVVADHVFTSHPDVPEGDLAKMRAAVVSAEALAAVAARVDLGAALLLGKGEEASGGREKPSILADAMEAVLGAVYVDAGPGASRDVILGLMGPELEAAAAGPGEEDFKTRLQELAAQRFDAVPRYDLSDEGPDHAKTFHATVYVNDVEYGRGVGRSKKLAEQAAAAAAWETLDPDRTAAVGQIAREHA